ncbi:MAG: hypothetical protein K0S76_1263 [Herbinix sp.]|nr:hypothetical protein [Herbinix sp.]
MKVVGLITEYNPFHNGHKYHIEEAKRITGADYTIAVMSGNFVQRGTPAVIDKYSRAEMALKNGVDLVLELPVCYATASAEYFAHGAVALLDKLGIVDYLCFGSECGDIGLLMETAKLLIDTPEGFDEQLLTSLKEGLTYPAARTKAIEQIWNQKQLNQQDNAADADTTIYNKSEISKVLSEPNNILGIEYLKALIKLSSSIVPVTIERKSAHYHAKLLADQEQSYAMSLSESTVTDHPVISSATAIRGALLDHHPAGLALSENSVPKDVFEILSSCFNKTFPITEEDFAGILKYKLLFENNRTLTSYSDITNGLADRIKNLSDYNVSLAQLAQNIKTRNMTLTRINRAFIHILLNIQKSTFDEYNQKGYAFYARVLGIKKESSHLLRKITKADKIPVITKVSKADKQLDALGLRMLSGDLFAAHIYNQAVYEKYKTTLLNEYKHGICMI